MASSASSSSVPAWLARWSPFSSARLSDHIVASEIRAVEAPVHANQRVEKSFAIGLPSRTDESPPQTELLPHSVQEVHVEAPGLTVVRVRPDLVDELGPDVVARVRVSSDAEEHLERLTVGLSDKHALSVGFSAPGRGTRGHLVTEIDVPREAEIYRVVAMCGGDVVVHDGVLGCSPRTTASSDGVVVKTQSDTVAELEDASGLLSMNGSRLFLAAPQSTLRFDSLILGAFGTGSIHVQADHLVATKNLIACVLGRGHVGLEARLVGTAALNLPALGDGGSIALTAHQKFHAVSILSFLKGDGSVRITTPNNTASDQLSSLSQEIHVSRGGTVDLADMRAAHTSIALERPRGGDVRIRGPLEKLTVDGHPSLQLGETSERAAIQHVGTLPSDVYINTSSRALAELSDADIASVRGEWNDGRTAVVPTIESAFEKPAALEKPREGWFLDFAVPAVRSLLPF